MSKNYSKIHEKIIQISIHLPKKHAKNLNTVVTYMKKYTNFHTITQEIYKFSETYSKIHEKAY